MGHTRRNLRRANATAKNQRSAHEEARKVPETGQELKGETRDTVQNDDPKYIGVLLDESGSMGKIVQSTIEGFNSYLGELQGDPNASDVRFSLTTFNSHAFVRRRANQDLTQVKSLDRDSYQPRGMTPLYDAVVKTIRDMENYTSNEQDPDVVVTILTDGLENTSKAYGAIEVKQLIESKLRTGWVFSYLGAEQDAWAVAARMGIDRDNAANFDRTDEGVGKAFGAYSKAIRARYETPRSERSLKALFIDEMDRRSGRLK